MVGDVSIAELPAMSVMVIVCVLALPCAVKSNGLGGLEEATPESESLGKKMTETSVLFQPALLGAGFGGAKMAVGAVLSMLNAGEVNVAELPAMSVRVMLVVMPVPSVERSKGLTGLAVAKPESESAGVYGNEMSLLFQPWALGGGFALPNVIVGALLSILKAGEM